MTVDRQTKQKCDRCFSQKAIRAAALLAAVALTSLGWSSCSQASEYLQIYRSSNGGVFIYSPDAKQSSLARPGDKIRLRQDTLLIAPDHKSWAALQFLQDGVVKSYAGLLLKTVPSWQRASYTFPCTASGKFHIVWRPVVRKGFRACGGGLTLVPAADLATSETGASLPPEFEWLFAAVSWPFAEVQGRRW